MPSLNKHTVDDYLKCPHLCAKNILSNKAKIKDISSDCSKFKDIIRGVASFELKNNCKQSLYEYRIKWTNSAFSKNREVIDDKFIKTDIIPELNNIMHTFSDNIFIAYNAPVEFAITGTSVIYKNVVDFLMTKENGDMVAIEIEDIDNTNIKEKSVKTFSYLRVIYSYLAATFKKKLTLFIIDPVKCEKIELVFLPSMFEEDLLNFSKIVKNIFSNNYYKNLYFCDKCSLLAECD